MASKSNVLLAEEDSGSSGHEDNEQDFGSVTRKKKRCKRETGTVSNNALAPPKGLGTLPLLYYLIIQDYW
ncbi:hypothetical protein GN956_G6981 [Arapaima gigas]